MGLRGIEEDGTEGEGTKADMTDHVKDISCHGPLSLLSSKAFAADLLSLLIQNCSIFNICTAHDF